MAELFSQLLASLLLLVVAPQLVGYVSSIALRRRGVWWPYLLGVVLPPLLFWAISVSFFSPQTSAAFRSGLLEGGGIELADVRLGAAAHAGAGLLLQLYRLFRGD